MDFVQALKLWPNKSLKRTPSTAALRVSLVAGAAYLCVGHGNPLDIPHRIVYTFVQIKAEGRT
jgi:hypothetical protein